MNMMKIITIVNALLCPMLFFSGTGTAQEMSFTDIPIPESSVGITNINAAVNCPREWNKVFQKDWTVPSKLYTQYEMV